MLIVAIHILELLIDDAAMPRGMQVQDSLPAFGEGLRKAREGLDMLSRACYPST